MERLNLRGPAVVWRYGTVTALIDESPHAKTIELDVPGWPGHAAGQHVDVRLTADDGYQTQRSYSIASAPEDSIFALTVERIDDGEVSPYLTEELRAGDELELRGPVGGHFTWRVDDGGPLLLIAGGSGLVPLMAHARANSMRDCSFPHVRLTTSCIATSSRPWRQPTDSFCIARLLASRRWAGPGSRGAST